MILQRCTEPRHTDRRIPRMKMTGIIASDALSILSGCQTLEQMDTGLISLRGRPYKAAFHVLGYPDAESKIEGKRVFTREACAPPCIRFQRLMQVGGERASLGCENKTAPSRWSDAGREKLAMFRGAPGDTPPQASRRRPTTSSSTMCSGRTHNRGHVYQDIWIRSRSHALQSCGLIQKARRFL
ncbi:hypothetical protein BQ8482_220057 [Mesorhizobium delmotii]|uniref:Uncharacterized protein n=1 Tax=Mesorhizobium delmotii TaxID=1631247 RepID=A0A2P9AL80_9HYPH|nr:hypothetical protein BQ8482_220057 [Mesorhizobium delmotii]